MLPNRCEASFLRFPSVLRSTLRKIFFNLPIPDFIFVGIVSCSFWILRSFCWTLFCGSCYFLEMVAVVLTTLNLNLNCWFILSSRACHTFYFVVLFGLSHRFVPPVDLFALLLPTLFKCWRRCLNYFLMKLVERGLQWFAMFYHMDFFFFFACVLNVTGRNNLPLFQL